MSRPLRRYLNCLEKEFPWIKPDPIDPSLPYCKHCHSRLAARKSSLARHANTQDHKLRVNAANSSFPIITQKPGTTCDKLKTAELEFAACICCHSSVLTIDHLGEIVKKNAFGSKLCDLKLHRTKMSRLIDFVLAPSLKEDLANDLQDVFYSVLIDESTDVAIHKNMAIAVKYYSKKSALIETAFLGLIPVIEATGEALFNALKSTLSDMGLPLSRCIGFASDMVGQYNSVWSRIHEESPHCIQFRCICHSLALAIQKAFDTLPSHLGYLLSEIPSWFSNSTLRCEEYKTLFEGMVQDGKAADKAPSPFLKMSTRWLVRGKLISNVLQNWSILKSYFEAAMSKDSGQDVRYKARTLYEILCDDANLLYFAFLAPVVNDFDRVNVFFQQKDADSEAMVKQLDLLHRSLKLRICDRHGQHLAISCVDFGHQFASECARITRKPLAPSSLESVKSRCHMFLKSLLVQVEQRLPPAKEAFRNVSRLHPHHVLSQAMRVPFSELPLQHLMSNAGVVGEQYRKILLQNWREESIFDGTIPNDTQTFWRKILIYEICDGYRPYEQLAQYALSTQCVPVSNAVVERIFSHVTNIKTKYRNRLSLKMLEAILRIRLHLQLQGKCCRDMTISKTMLSKFNSAMYVVDDDVQDISALLE